MPAGLCVTATAVWLRFFIRSCMRSGECLSIVGRTDGMNEQHVTAADMRTHLAHAYMHARGSSSCGVGWNSGTAVEAYVHCTIASVRQRMLFWICTSCRSPLGCFKGPSRGTPTCRLVGVRTGFQRVLRDDERGIQWELGSACRWRLRGDHGYSRGTHRILAGYSGVL
jgi:hypothetical protein